MCISDTESKAKIVKAVADKLGANEEVLFIDDLYDNLKEVAVCSDNVEAVSPMQIVNFIEG